MPKYIEDKIMKSLNSNPKTKNLSLEKRKSIMYAIMQKQGLLNNSKSEEIVEQDVYEYALKDLMGDL